MSGKKGAAPRKPFRAGDGTVPGWTFDHRYLREPDPSEIKRSLAFWAAEMDRVMLDTLTGCRQASLFALRRPA